MRREAILGAVTAVNLVLFAATALMQILPAKAQDAVGILRGSGLEIVDGGGRLRSSISILPAAAGEAETVLFRLDHAKRPALGQDRRLDRQRRVELRRRRRCELCHSRSRRTRNPAQDGGTRGPGEGDCAIGRNLRFRRPRQAPCPAHRAETRFHARATKTCRGHRETRPVRSAPAACPCPPGGAPLSPAKPRF